MRRSFANRLAVLLLFFGFTAFAQTPTPAPAPEQVATPVAEKSSTPTPPSWTFDGSAKNVAVFTGTSESGNEKLLIPFVHGELDYPTVQFLGEVNLTLTKGSKPKGPRISKVILSFDDGAPVEEKLEAFKDDLGTFRLLAPRIEKEEALEVALYSCKKMSIEYYPEGKSAVTAVFNMADLPELTRANKIKVPQKHHFGLKDALSIAVGAIP